MALPVLTFPPELPVSACRDEIAEAVFAHQVVVIAGETGSGKTTQLPKICLALGRDAIAHTQPRRIAATSVAKRIADETETELGDVVGYSVRFSDKSSKHTKVKVMTDGILLREINSDPTLRRYDTIIIDEAHERSLNIDFLLGYLKRLLPRRPDLKVIITSATIEPDRFARHFATADQEVPILEVSGRTYPVDVRYRPLTGHDDEHTDLDQLAAIDAAVTELWRAERGDILVFLPTEREIRETAEALKHRREAEIVPLYARLSVAEQQKIFTPSNGRRIVLSTNVAETSLTVPGIRYVIDTGTARISRYSARTKVTRLPIEKVSQASARQRAGRCGRVAPGICIRLYAEDDFDARPEYTDPEILRANLAAVILSMLALRLGDVAEFPFVQPPAARAVSGGMALLSELGAVTGLDSADAQLTQIGRELARLPVDPRLARMLIAGHENGCLDHILVITAALSLPDVREFPADKREAAQTAHRQYAVPGSEFLSRLALWEHLQQQRSTLSGNQFRRYCERHYLHYLRIREWTDLYRQLRRTVRDFGWEVPESAVDPDAIHRSLLTGLLTNIGNKVADTRDYLGTRGTTFTLFPASELAKKPPAFIMAAELMETSRLFAHTAASIDPEWVEQIAPELVTRTYSEPAWSSRRGTVMANEKVSLYGVPLVAQRRVNYAAIDPVEARAIFLQAALVEGRWRTRHEFYAHNRRLLDEAEDLEHRARRVVRRSDGDLYDFYDARIPAEVVSTRHFDTWWKKESRRNPRLLDLDEAGPSPAGVPAAADFPTAWQQGTTQLELRYHFAPGSPDDGVTVVIPLPLLEHVHAGGFDWLVPGLRSELATALIRSLPKGLRKSLSPAQQYADLALSKLVARSEPLLPALARELAVITRISLSPSDFRTDTLATHLRMHFAATDSTGAIVATADRLDQLRAQFADSASAVDTSPAHRRWTADGIGTLAQSRSSTVAGQPVTTYPTLAPSGDGVRVVEVTSTAARDAGIRAGIQTLLEHAIAPLNKKVATALPPAERLALSQSPYPDTAALLADCTRRAIVDALAGRADAAQVRGPEQFARVEHDLSPKVRATAPEYFTAATAALRALPDVRRAIDAHSGSAAADDVAEQLAHLIFDGFIGQTPLTRLQHLPRYLNAARIRLESLPGAAARDARGLAAIDRVIAHWNQRLAQLPAAQHNEVSDRAHWGLEELRVSLFAQQLGTVGPVSEKRLIKSLDAVQ